MRVEVPVALDGERVDRAVSLLTGLTRAEVAGLVDAGVVRLDGRPAPSRGRRVRAGQRLEADLPERSTPEAPEPDPAVAVPVVFEDRDLVVVDKPAGLVVHPGAGRRSGTLVNGLLARYPELADLAGPAAPGRGDDRDRPGIVHRLDRGTSGLLVVARTDAARRHLVGQLAARSVDRRYAALVAGSVDADEGLVDAPLGRSERDPTRVAVRAGGRPARTRYRVEGRSRVGDVAVTRLACRLETGRTHQIRAHLSAIGHPVVGDGRYGGPPDPTGSLAPGRVWLHAQVLAFDHPSSGERLRFESPLPADLAAVLDPRWRAPRA